MEVWLMTIVNSRFDFSSFKVDHELLLMSLNWQMLYYILYIYVVTRSCGIFLDL